LEHDVADVIVSAGVALREDEGIEEASGGGRGQACGRRARRASGVRESSCECGAVSEENLNVPRCYLGGAGQREDTWAHGEDVTEGQGVDVSVHEGFREAEVAVKGDAEPEDGSTDRQCGGTPGGGRSVRYGRGEDARPTVIFDEQTTGGDGVRQCLGRHILSVQGKQREYLRDDGALWHEAELVEDEDDGGLESRLSQSIKLSVQSSVASLTCLPHTSTCMATRHFNARVPHFSYIWHSSQHLCDAEWDPTYDP